MTRKRDHSSRQLRTIDGPQLESVHGGWGIASIPIAPPEPTTNFTSAMVSKISLA